MPTPPTNQSHADTSEKPHTPPPDTTYRDKEWLQTRYVTHEQSQTTIADHVGVSRTTIRRWLEKHGIERRSGGSHPSGNTEKLKDENWLRRQYVAHERTQADIAEELNVSGYTVSKYIHTHGIDTRDPSEIHSTGTVAPLKDEQWIYEQYVTQERTTTEIATSLGVSHTTVSNYLHDHGIETR